MDNAFINGVDDRYRSKKRVNASWVDYESKHALPTDCE